VAERLNRTLTTIIRPMLSGAGLPTALWGEAAQTANYVRNRLPRRYGDRVATPEEMWTGKRTYLGHLRVFSCVAYTHVAKERRGKLDENAKRGIFVDYTPTTRQYRVFDPQKRTIDFPCSSFTVASCPFAAAHNSGVPLQNKPVAFELTSTPSVARSSNPRNCCSVRAPRSTLQGGVYGNALQAASIRGHENIVELLLHEGAER
jgi:hypothetical protein